MSTKYVPGADIKAATLKMQLHADSGYEASAEYRVSADQWARILSVAEDGEKGLLIASAPDLLDALRAFLRAPSVGSAGPGSVTIAVQDFNLRAARAAIAKVTGCKK